MWKRNYIIPVLWLIVLILNFQNFFFWDTIQLASKQACFFFDNNFTSFFLPQEINSGHPPFYGLTLAFFWSFLGKSLLVSHLFNTLFVLGFVYQALLLGQFFLGISRAFWFPLVLFCNPIFLGHSILVSPDNALIFLLFLGLNGILKKKIYLILMATVFLSLLSMRGMMVVFSIFLGEFIWTYLKDKTWRIKLIFKYFPAGMAALAFFISHYIHNNWLGFHEGSPWEESFESVSLLGYLRNLGLVAWRLIDFGNIFLVLGAGLLLIRLKFKHQHIHFFLAFFLAFIVVLILPLAGFKYLTAHRYFMPIYALISFLFIVVIIEKVKIKLAAILLVLLFLGNWWIYPRSISQGWDVSLGHVPFYNLVEKMNDYVQDEDIDANEIGTEFPIKSESRFLYLDKNQPSYQEAKIGDKKYIIYSKVINDYKDVDYEKLQKDYKLKKAFNYLFIELELYEKR